MILVDDKLALSRIDIDDGRVSCIVCGDGSTVAMDGSVAIIISNDSSDTTPIKRIRRYKDILFLYNNKFRCDICADIDTDTVEELYNKYKFFVIPENLKEACNLDNYTYRKSPSTNRTLFLLDNSDLYIKRDKDIDNIFDIKNPYGTLGSISLDRDERKYATFILSQSDACSHLSTCLFNEHTNSYTPFVYDWCNDKMYFNGNVMVDVDDDSDRSDDDNTQNNIEKDDIIIPPSPRNKLRDLLSNVMYFDKDRDITIIPGDDSICFANTNKHFTFLMYSGENQYDSDGYMINISNAISFNMCLSYVGYKQFFDIITDNNGKCRVGMPVPKTIYMTCIGRVFIVDNRPYTNASGEELKYEPFHVVDDKEDK